MTSPCRLRAPAERSLRLDPGRCFPEIKEEEENRRRQRRRRRKRRKRMKMEKQRQRRWQRQNSTHAVSSKAKFNDDTLQFSYKETTACLSPGDLTFLCSHHHGQIQNRTHFLPSSLQSCQTSVSSRRQVSPVDNSTLMIWEVRADCFSQDEHSNPSRECQVTGHFLNENVDQIRLVASLTFALLMDEGIVPPAR
ncbi:uncharacterized protein [Oryctolagus cuniculus]|uniref:uncharacterized protein isoform X2 n=1 Tax=Oryctolagus cuniculus TaxID=9986 RepID=UPI00387A2FC7